MCEDIDLVTLSKSEIWPKWPEFRFKVIFFVLDIDKIIENKNSIGLTSQICALFRLEKVRSYFYKLLCAKGGWIEN